MCSQCMSNCRFSVVKLDFRAHQGTPGTTLQETISMMSNQGCPVSYQPSLAATSGWRLWRVTIYESMLPEHIPKSCPDVPLVLLLFSSHVATKKNISSVGQQPFTPIAAGLGTPGWDPGKGRRGSCQGNEVFDHRPLQLHRSQQGGRSRWVFWRCPTANVLRYRVQLG